MRRASLCVFAVFVSVAGVVVSAGPAVADSVSPASVAAVAQGLNARISWSDGAATGVTGYVVSSSPASSQVTVPAGSSSAVLTGLRPGVAYTALVAAQTDSGVGAAVASSSTVSVGAPGGALVGLTPARLLDTRSGVGAPFGPSGSVSLQVTGRGGVPLSGVGSVALNVTVAGPARGGYVTAYPAGQGRPTASNLNFVAHQTKANLVVVPLGTAGRVVLYASTPVQLVADVAGYYTTTAAASTRAGAGLFHPLAPVRVMDTRTKLGGTAPAGGHVTNLTVTGVGGVPASGVSAVVLNATVTAPAARGYVTVFPAGRTRPTASTVNFTTGQTVANRVIVPVGTDGTVSFYNGAPGTTQLVADLAGWYSSNATTAPGGSYYIGVSPHRLVDTRTGTGGTIGPVAAGGVAAVQVTGVDAIPTASGAMPPTAANLTVTITGPTSSTYATVYPSLSARPTASDVNAPAHTTVANLTIATLGSDGAVNVVNNSGTTQFVVDIAGYFIGGTDIPSTTVTPPADAITAVTGDPAQGPATVTLDAAQTAPPVGAVLTSGVTDAAPNGLLAQVTATSTDPSGDTVLTTQPATLQQALGDASINVAAPLGADDLAMEQTGQSKTRSLRTRRTLTRPVIAARTRLSPAVAHATAGGPVSGTDNQPCTNDSGSSVKISRSFNPTLLFHADLGHSGLTPTLQAKAGVDLSESAGVTISYGAKVSCTWHAQLAKYTFNPLAFDVAGVPVVIVPVLTVNLDASITGQATISASVQQTFHAQAGLQYDSRTNATTPYHSVTNTLTHTGPSLTAAGGTASIGLTADLEGKLYGLTGPDASLTATITGSVDVTKTPWWTLGFTLAGQAALHMKELFIHVDVTVTVDLIDTEIAHATAPPTSAPPVITTTLLAGATVGVPYSAQLTTADHRPGSWAVTGGGLPTGLSLSGFTIGGTPAVAGTNRFTLVFTDTHNKSSTASASITVTGSTSVGAGTAAEAPLPADAAADPNAHLSFVDCADENFCTAIGEYYDRSGHSHGLLETLSNGVWTAIKAPLPANAAGYHEVDLFSVSCGGAGFCTAAGQHYDRNGGSEGLLETLSNGVWTPIKAPLPANSGSYQSGDLFSVNCAGSGSCTAVGAYYDSRGNSHGLLETLSNGVWTAIKAPLPTSALSSPEAELNSVDCTGASSCTAVGHYRDTSGNPHGLLVTLSNGVWTAVEAPRPTNADQAGADLFSVRCAGVGSCTAVGYYLNLNRNQLGLIETLSNGVWTAVEAPLPADADDYQDVYLKSVSCAGAGYCTAVGLYANVDGLGTGLLETYSDGTWTPVEAPLPSSPAGYGAVSLLSVSCTGVGSCTAVGGYRDRNIDAHGLVETLSNGAWTAGEAPLPVNAGGHPNADLASVSCSGADCRAVGGYSDNSANAQGLLATIK